MDNFTNLLISLNPFRNSNSKKIIEEYVNSFGLSKNTKYPYFIENDCTNFISQCIHEAGAIQSYGFYGNHGSWFCSTNNSSELTKISLSWRTAKYFRIYWADPYTKKYRCQYYSEIWAKDALKDYTNSLFDKLEIGDVIQYINYAEDSHPYHTQVIHRKEITDKFPYTNLFVAQHSADRVNVSLHEYISNAKNRDQTKICLYKILK